MTITAFLIQQEGAERWMISLVARWRGGGGGGTIPAGLRLSTAEKLSRGETDLERGEGSRGFFR